MVVVCWHEEELVTYYLVLQDSHQYSLLQIGYTYCNDENDHAVVPFSMTTFDIYHTTKINRRRSN